jgi:hypothetical protein
MFRPTFIPVQVQPHKTLTVPPPAPYFVWLTTIPRNYKNDEKTHAEVMVCEKCKDPITLTGTESDCANCASAYHYIGKKRRGLTATNNFNAPPVPGDPYRHRFVGVVQDARTAVAVSVSAQISGVVENDVTGFSRGLESYNDW